MENSQEQTHASIILAPNILTKYGKYNFPINIPVNDLSNSLLFKKLPHYFACVMQDRK